jgi:hypothetical protein
MSDPGWQNQWGQQPPPPQWGQPHYQRSSGEATAALVLGICGIVVCPIVCSILALVFGYRARREIDNSGGMIGGRGNAIAGIVTGWIGLGLWVLGIIAYVVIIVALIGATSSNDFSTLVWT